VLNFLSCISFKKPYARNAAAPPSNAFRAFLFGTTLRRSTIWIRAYTEGSSVINKTWTIEVRGNEIVQIRGKVNRLATELEMDIIKKWAVTAGLQLVV
jgi:hypothetical protein